MAPKPSFLFKGIKALDTFFSFDRMIAGRKARTHQIGVNASGPLYCKENNKKSVVEVQKKISLRDYNTMKIDCLAEYFVEARDRRDVFSAAEYARENNLSLLILGKGSNVILPEHFPGLVLFLSMDKVELEERRGSLYFTAGAGTYLPDASRVVTEKKGRGLEWAGGVPGSIGGAVRGNAGAFEDIISDYVEKVTAAELSTGKEKQFKREECRFGYRESIFKKNRDYVVLEVEMKFPIEEGTEKRYREYLDYRESRHPQDPSAGSIFKNPVVKETFFEKFRETEKFKKMGFVPVSFLIEQCGLKGKSVGGMQISEKHANFIINREGGTKEDIQRLIELTKEAVKERFGIDIEEEVEIVEV